MSYRITYIRKYRSLSVMELQSIISVVLICTILMLQSALPDWSGALRQKPGLLQEKFFVGYARGENLRDLAVAYCAGVMEGAGYEDIH